MVDNIHFFNFLKKTNVFCIFWGEVATGINFNDDRSGYYIKAIYIVGRQEIETMTNEPRTPRFHAHFTHVQGLPVITLTRDQWEKLIDISESPVSAVAACVTACAAERFSSTKQGVSDGFVDVYRYDPADGSTPINKDKYLAWNGESVQHWDDFMDRVRACVTTING